MKQRVNQLLDRVGTGIDSLKYQLENDKLPTVHLSDSEDDNELLTVPTSEAIKFVYYFT